VSFKGRTASFSFCAMLPWSLIHTGFSCAFSAPFCSKACGVAASAATAVLRVERPFPCELAIVILAQPASDARLWAVYLRGQQHRLRALLTDEILRAHVRVLSQRAKYSCAIWREQPLPLAMIQQSGFHTSKVSGACWRSILLREGESRFLNARSSKDPTYART